MIFSSLRVVSFRNLADGEISTGSKDVFLMGENGQGKTNFLEALYFCSYSSSFRSVHDRDLARNGEQDFSVAVNIQGGSGSGVLDGGVAAISGQTLIKIEKGKKTVFINGKKCDDRKDLLSVAPCIVFCHEDMDFVSGTQERRRWFFDQALSLYDPVYLDDLRRYRRVLKSRNILLRDFSLHRSFADPGPVLDALDPQLAEYGVKLMEQRETAARLFSAVFGPLYREVAGIDRIAVNYLPSWKGTTRDESAAWLMERRQGDLSAGASLSGPHRDRYVFSQGDTEFAARASTGQRRLLALLLRVAQARRFSEMTGRKPALLLDDVLLEMDGEKRRKFLSIMPDYDQAFYTFLPEEPFERYRKNDTLVYHVNGGKLSEESR
jgi:DNA replication and repair protein RecF